MNSEEGRRTGAQTTAERMLFRLREVGLERAFAVALELVYLAWRWSRTRDGLEKWRALCVDAPRGINQGFGLTEDANSRLADEIELVPARVLEDVIDAIDELRKDGGDSSLIAAVEHLVELYTRRAARQGGEHSSPEWLADLLAGLTGPGKRVADPACGYGSILRFQAPSADDLVGTDVNHGALRVAEIRLAMAGAKAHLERQDGFKLLNTGIGSFDVVATQPPWGVTLADEQRAILKSKGVSPNFLSGQGSRSGVAWAALASMMLRPGGRAAVVLPTTASQQSTALSECLDQGMIEAVISLPQRFWTATTLAGHVWLLRPRGETGSRILMIDASRLTHQSPKDQAELSEEARSRIAGLVTRFRETGDIDSEEHLARVVARHELEERAGITPPAYLAPAPEEPESVPEAAGHLLQQLEIEGYKSFGGRTSAPLGPITLVYGPNSSGKSSLIQSLLLLRQSIGHQQLITQGPDADVGSFLGVRHRHEPRSIGFGLSFGAPVWALPENGTADPRVLRSMSFRFIDQGDGRGVLASASISAGPVNTDWIRNDSGGMVGSTWTLQETFSEIAAGTFLYPRDTRLIIGEDTASRERQDRNRRRSGRSRAKRLRDHGVEDVTLRWEGLVPADRPPKLPALHRSDREQSTMQSYVDRTARILSGVGAELKAVLDDMVYLGPQRSAPQRFYSRTAAAGLSGDGRTAALTLFDSATALEHVNQWFETMEIPYEVEVLPVGMGRSKEIIGDLMAIGLRDRRSDVAVSPADVGYGISQIMPIVIELATRTESVVCIEQPETHLHPRLQASLGDLFLDSIRADGRRNQLIVETHSEHLLLRIQRRIREHGLDPETVAVLYVDQDDQGEATVQRLRMDEDGDFIDEWPGGFFDERLDELFGSV